MNISDYKKETLLALARNNEKKPKPRSVLGMALSRYLCITSNSYDRQFAKEIKALAPNWFIVRSHNNKAILLDWAKKNYKKPTKSQILGRALVNYTNPTQYSYDKHFAMKIKQIRPDWFTTT